MATHLRKSIPDSDGLYGRGFRDSLDSVRLALRSAGVEPHLIDDAIRTAVAAYGSSASKAQGAEEIQQVLTVSTGHLTPAERESLDNGVSPGESRILVSMRGEYGWLVWVPETDPKEEDPEESALSGLSDGFRGVVERARAIGAHYIRFDADARYLSNVTSYDDDGQHKREDLVPVDASGQG